MRKLSDEEMQERGLCVKCGKSNPTPGKRVCPECHARQMRLKRENSEYYKKIGICCRCHKREAEPNRVLCYECAGGQIRNYTEKDRDRKRRLRDERLENGLCPKCGKEPSLHDGLGAKCRAYLKRYRERTRGDIGRSEWPSYGRCYCCGNTELLSGKKVCAACYETRLKTMEVCWAHMDNSYWKSTGSFGKGGMRENENKALAH